ncbi:c-type cytochrome [Wenzhouxiangella sp. EGI_FJ10409]|uniref:c-type cytochrome n=1 Tax=Wenzhouxiangella sp. EGI_FJ10409 TaxID=3243767 RepID=UPI0035D9C2F6
MLHCKQSLAAAVLLLSMLAGCGGSDGPDQAQSPGEAAFGRHCAGCHGMQGQGRPPAFPPLAGSEWMALPPEALTAIVLLGLRGEIEVSGRVYAGYMPPMQHIDDARVADIVAYVKLNWAEDAPDWTAADVAGLRSALAGRPVPEGREGLERLLEELP